MHYSGLVHLGGNLVYLSAVKTFDKATGKIEFVIIASFNKQDQILINYKERWQIETMFQAMKTSGFNIKNTHLNNLERLSTLISVISIAFIWAYLAGIDEHEKTAPIKIKKHGRRAFSFFKYGLIKIAHALSNALDISEFNKCVKVLSCTCQMHTTIHWENAFALSCIVFRHCLRTTHTYAQKISKQGIE
jgi:hypothetical protein